MTTRWDPDQYLRFQDERSRPFDDLLARIPVGDARFVTDLGCGPGTTTAELVGRWPAALILGIDSSPEMIEKAHSLEIPGHLEFRVGDLRDWQPGPPLDVLLSCATLQWIPGHIDLFPRFVGSLASGGVFAFQVPGNFDQPSHTLLHELATSERWRDRLAGAVSGSPRSLEPETYLTALLRTGATADVWETTYLHVLSGPDAVFNWTSGTALRPVLAALDEGPPADKDEFLAAYAAELRTAYPSDRDGRTIFPFRRIFGIATAR